MATERSRDPLAAVITTALRDGPAWTYACGWGDEHEPAVGRSIITLAELADRFVPFTERVALGVRTAYE